MRNIAILATLIVASAAQADNYSARGIVQATHQATLSSELAARIQDMPFRAGDAFQKGSTLVQFDCAIFEAQRDKVEAQKRSAEATLANNRKLEALHSIGALDVTLSEVAVQQIDAELRMARINTDRCTIKAPWSGRVVQRMASAHESVRLNQELLSIVANDKLEVAVVVPATWLKWLKPGAQFNIQIDETGSKHKGKVIATGGMVDAVSQTLTVRGSIQADGHLLAGMSGTAEFPRK